MSKISITLKIGFVFASLYVKVIIQTTFFRKIYRSVKFVNSFEFLVVILYADLKVNHIHSNVQNINCKVNSLLFDFIDIASDVKSKQTDP